MFYLGNSITSQGKKKYETPGSQNDGSRGLIDKIRYPPGRVFRFCWAKSSLAGSFRSGPDGQGPPWVPRRSYRELAAQKAVSWLCRIPLSVVTLLGFSRGWGGIPGMDMGIRAVVVSMSWLASPTT